MKIQFTIVLLYIIKDHLKYIGIKYNYKIYLNYYFFFYIYLV